jgi:hypothetical protein
MEKEEYKFPPMEPGECNEVKVGDKIIVYDKYFRMNKEVEVTEIGKVYDVYTFEPVLAVMITWSFTNIQGETHTETKRLNIPDLYDLYVYYNSKTKERITQLTFKN